MERMVMSDIEGKAAQGSSERAKAASEFQLRMPRRRNAFSRTRRQGPSHRVRDNSIILPSSLRLDRARRLHRSLAIRYQGGTRCLQRVGMAEIIGLGTSRSFFVYLSPRQSEAATSLG